MPRPNLRTAALVELPLEQHTDILQAIRPTHDRMPTVVPAVQISVPFLSYHFLARRCLPLSLELRFRTTDDGAMCAIVVFQNDGLQHRIILPLVEKKSRAWARFCLMNGLVILSVLLEDQAPPRHETVLHGTHLADNVRPLLAELVQPSKGLKPTDDWIEKLLSEHTPSAFTHRIPFSCTDYIYQAST